MDNAARIEQIKAEIAELQQKKLDNLARRLAHVKANRIEYFNSPNPPQQKLIEAFLDPRYKVLVYTGGNRSGKTTISVILALCTMFGKLPWNGTELVFPHRGARRVRIVGQDFEKHIKTVLEPKLAEWWPKSRPLEVKKNNIGIRAFWKDVLTGSTLEILSNQSESDVAEGWDGDLILYDEPPKRDMRIACARGLVDRKGKEIFSMTLLKEAWISREVMRAVDENGEPDRSIFCVNATIYDNVGYGITKEGVDQFEKTLTEDEKKARLFGIPSYMSTLVLPEFNRQVHLKKRFPIPFDWVNTVAIDYHPSAPQAVLFKATEPVGLHWVHREIYEHCHPKTLAENIVRIIQTEKLRVDSIIIDPLAKGDSNNIQTVFDIMNNVFMSAGYSLRLASKDKEIGITAIRSLLRTQNEMPAIYFFDDLRETISQCEDWMYDSVTFKPIKERDHFPENLYRLCLLDTRWYPEEEYEEQPRRRVANSVTGY